MRTFADYSLFSLLDAKRFIQEILKDSPEHPALDSSPDQNPIPKYLQKQREDLVEIEQLIEVKMLETGYGKMAEYNSTGHNKLGEFNVSSGALMATDPCYKPGTWCQVPIENVENGTWFAYGLFKNEGSWSRCAEFVAIHKDYAMHDFSCEFPWQETEGEVGVDSGQAGVFDMKKYNTGITSGRENEGEVGDYDKICELTLNLDPNGNVLKGIPLIDYGWVTPSGYGDGGYRCFVAKALDGKVIGIKIIFIGAEEEDDFEDGDAE